MRGKISSPVKAIIALVIITGVGLSLPVADFTATPSSGSGPLKVELDASASQAGEFEVVEYEWDINEDGYMDLKGVKTSYSFYELGEHEVTLEVTDEEDRENTTTKKINVKEPEGGKVLETKIEETEDGYVYLEAQAGAYDNGTFSCEDVEMEVSINGAFYSLEDPGESYCLYTKEVWVGAGTHTIKFIAEYQDNFTRTEKKEKEIKGEKPELKIYVPQENTVKSENSSLFIEAEAVRGQNTLEGDFTVNLDTLSAELSKTDIGTYTGKINTGEAGNRTLTVTFSNDQWTVSEDIPIQVVEPGEGQISTGNQLDILHPKPGASVSENETVLFEVKLTGPNGLVLNDKEVNYNIEKNGETVSQGLIPQQTYLYTKPYEFEEPGEYTFTAQWEGLKKEIDIQVGSKEDLPEEERLNINLITPRATIYSYGSILNVKSIVEKQDQGIDNAEVIYSVDDQEPRDMNSGGNGEYTGSIEGLSKGRHQVTVVAEHDNETARETVPFKISGKSLHIEVVEPSTNETIQIKEEGRVTFKINVTDQNGVTAENALVKANIKSPIGKEAEVKLTQKEGLYTGEYYPGRTGEYSVTLNARKPNHVSSEEKLNIDVEVQKGSKDVKEAIGGLGMNLLLKIALGIAILILLVALVTRML